LDIVPELLSLGLDVSRLPCSLLFQNIEGIEVEPRLFSDLGLRPSNIRPTTTQQPGCEQQAQS